MKGTPSTAVFDACVLYPAPLRDFLMWLALSGLFRARWTALIHQEWQRNLLKNRPDLEHAQLHRTSALMNQAIPDAMVTGHELLIEGLELPDAADRHVLAAAIHCKASVIVTFNLKDFPSKTLKSFSVEARHPDAFIGELMDLDCTAVLTAARRHRSTLLNPPCGVDHYLGTLLKQGLSQTVKGLAAFRTVL
jgi:hypothetical protein